MHRPHGPWRRPRAALAVAALSSAVAVSVVSSSAAAQRPADQRAAASAEPGLARLEAQFAELAKLAGGTVGVAVIHLESGRAAYLNRGEPFPLASTVKVPLAVQLLTKVDRGELRLDSMITVRPVDLHPGSGTLTEMFGAPGVVQPGVALSVRNLMELMLRISDNAATDVLLRAAGGGAAVNGRLAALGVQGVRADRPTIRIIADYVGVTGLPSDEVLPMDFVRLTRAVTDSGRAAALAAFLADPRDTATPDGMAALLEKVWRQQALSPASTQLLLGMLSRVSTGPQRIKGLLPPATRVMHKTGTLAPSQGLRGGHVVNDVGIVDLPGGAGHLVTAVFVKNAADAARAEQTIAHIARTAYDYFLLVPAPASVPGGEGR